MKITLNKFLTIMILVPFFVMSVIYAAFSSELMIDGIAMLRVNADIRVTDLKVLEQTNGAYETYSGEFNKDTTKTNVTLPNINSTITYQAVITNKSDIPYDIWNIEIENDSNLGISYDLDIQVGDLIEANSEKIFTIKLYYDNDVLPDNIVDNLIIKYDFIEHINPYVVASYDYSGKVETFTAPINGIYKIELWGAEGGYYTTFVSGKGAYTTGDLTMNEGEQLYAVVGGKGSQASATATASAGGYNGGGKSYYSAGTGGGATDIRYGGTTLNARIMVAGGGGGSGVFDATENGGSGGALIGIEGGNYQSDTYTGYHGGTGGTQVSGGTYGDYWTQARVDCYLGTSGTFGVGGNGGYETNYEMGSGAGGGGYYGGGGGSERNGGGAGGSSYISGYVGSVAITSATSTSPKSGCTTGTTDIKCSYHYSGKVFTNTKMISGTASMPSKSGVGNSTGNIGNGYVKITFLKRIFENA